MITVRDLAKDFKDKKRRKFRALSHVTFECRPGEIFGLLGPNGAGKTTTLRIISTALKPSEGTAEVNGHDVRFDATAVRRSIGFLSTNTGLYGRLTPRETLTYFGRLYRMAETTISERIEELGGKFAMMDFLDRPCDALSTGMKQKVSITRAVLHDPPVMIFDEPTNGLDVLTSRIIIDFIRDCKHQGKTVLFSTHIMSEVRKLCDQVGMIHQGRLVYAGTVDQVRAAHGDDLDDAFVQLLNQGVES